jgi:hypothetical protein
LNEIRGGASLSYKVLQLSPQASTEVIRAKTAIQESEFYQPWSGAVSSSRPIGFTPSWLEDEANLEESGERNWISGLVLSTAFSASVWAGIALIVMRTLR